MIWYIAQSITRRMSGVRPIQYYERDESEQSLPLHPSTHIGCWFWNSIFEQKRRAMWVLGCRGKDCSLSSRWQHWIGRIQFTHPVIDDWYKLAREAEVASEIRWWKSLETVSRGTFGTFLRSLLFRNLCNIYLLMAFYRWNKSKASEPSIRYLKLITCRPSVATWRAANWILSICSFLSGFRQGATDGRQVIIFKCGVSSHCTTKWSLHISMREQRAVLHVAVASDHWTSFHVSNQLLDKNTLA